MAKKKLSQPSLMLVTYAKTFCILVDGACHVQPKRSRLVGRRIYIFNAKGLDGKSKGVELNDGTRHWSRPGLPVKRPQVLQPDSTAYKLASAAIGAFGDV
jgi:hypothetical protein